MSRQSFGARWYKLKLKEAEALLDQAEKAMECCDCNLKVISEAIAAIQMQRRG